MIDIGVHYISSSLAEITIKYAAGSNIDITTYPMDASERDEQAALFIWAAQQLIGDRHDGLVNKLQEIVEAITEDY